MIDEQSETCPHCGAPLSGENQMVSEHPKTIEELQTWYVTHNLPPEEVTRFFVGKNITEPKAFGIYKNETGDFVVYKNKSTGERAIRYQGADEAYAVNELYQRLKAEIADQKAANASKPETPPTENKSKFKGCGCLTIIAALLIGGVFAITRIDSTPNGYYKYQNAEYYHYGRSWYMYDAQADRWLETESLSEFITDDNADQYKYSDHKGMRFEETSWYDNDDGDDDDDDDDSRWDDDDDWDSESTDWDSDW